MYIIDNVNDLERHIYLLEIKQEKEWSDIKQKVLKLKEQLYPLNLIKSTFRSILNNNSDKVHLMRAFACLAIGSISNGFISKSIIKLEAASIIKRHRRSIISLIQFAINKLRT